MAKIHVLLKKEELDRERLAGKTVIVLDVLFATSTLVAALGHGAAAHIYAAALLNGGAVVRHVARTHPDETVLIVCSGSADNFNLEDFYAAGRLVALFERDCPGHEYSDAAIAARLLAERNDAGDCLRGARVGRMMEARGLADEVDYAARSDRFDVVPKFEDDRLRDCADHGPLPVAGTR